MHATAPDAAATDWLRIVTLYDELMDVYPSPVVELNRAIAVGMSDGPLAGLRELDAVAGQLGDLYVVPAARWRAAGAGRPYRRGAHELDRAIALAPSEPVRRQLRRRRDRLDDARE